VDEKSKNENDAKNDVYLIAVPCVCVFLSWLGCHYCGRDWEQRKRLPPSAGTTCSDEWHSVWLLLPWDGNEYVQVCVVMVTSYQEQSCIGNDYVQVCIALVTSYREQSRVGNEYVQVCIALVTSYQEQSHVGNEYVQVLLFW